jgi:hypothetical protein
MTVFDNLANSVIFKVQTLTDFSLFVFKMSFSRQTLVNELKQRKISVQSVNYRDELKQLIVEKCDYGSVGDLNQDQLDEVDNYVKSMVGNVRNRWNRSHKNYSRMLDKFPLYFNEIVSLSSLSISVAKPSTSGIFKY